MVVPLVCCFHTGSIKIIEEIKMVKKTSVRKHPRKTKKGRTVVRQHKRKVNKRPSKIGSKWTGEKYVHGPRQHKPSRYSEFRLGKPNSKGERLVFGKVKGSDNWEVQSKLTPKNRGAVPPLEEIGAYSRYEIQPKRKFSRGKKGEILDEIDYLSNVLQTVKDLPEERRSELESKLDLLEQKAKRIQGRPPRGVVRGETQIQLKEGLTKRYAKTSTRKPEFVKALDLPSEIKTPYDKMEEFVREESQRQRSREHAGMERLLRKLDKMTEEQAIGDERFKFLRLEDIKRSPRGKQLKYVTYELKKEKKNRGSYMDTQLGRDIGRFYFKSATPMFRN